MREPTNEREHLPEEREPIRLFSKEYFKVVLGAYWAMLPVFLALAGSMVLVYLLVRFVW